VKVVAYVKYRSSLARRLLVWAPAAFFFFCAGLSAVIGGTVVAPIVLGLLYAAVASRATRRKAGDEGPGDAPAVLLEASEKRRDLVIHEGDKGMRIRAESIRSGHVVPSAGGRTARLVLDGRFGRDFEAWIPEIDAARTLLSDLGLGPLDRPMTYAFFFGLRVTVAVDGVLVAWPLLGKRRFVAHAHIDDVRWTGDHVVLLLKNGDRYEIATRGGDAHEALVERLLSARDAYRKAEGSEPLAALARGERSVAAWVKELRAMAETAGAQYRSAAVPAETLWRIALDPKEKEELRIGASLALRAALDDDGRTKLRVAADASASPRVRIALAAAAEEDDDDAIAEAIEAHRK
jgi:hypothetical protein